jgi:hypothetical protein
MSDSDRRQHERIAIELPTRLWLNEARGRRPVQFEGYAVTRDIAVGGTFVQSNYLLPIGCPINLEMQVKDGVISARGEVVHKVGADEAPESGMGIIFTEVDAINRERLLRFFINDTIRRFYEDRFIVEFPHLKGTMSLQDIALVLNLWEDKDGRVEALHGAGDERQRDAHRDEEVRATKRRAAS